MGIGKHLLKMCMFLLKKDFSYQISSRGYLVKTGVLIKYQSKFKVFKDKCCQKLQEKLRSLIE